MTRESPALVALAERAELIRAQEVRRCRKLRNDAQLRALAEQASASVIAALLRPISVYVARHEDRRAAEQRVRRLFDLQDSLAPDVRDTREDLAA